VSSTNAQQALASASAYIAVMNANRQSNPLFPGPFGSAAAFPIATEYLDWLNAQDAKAAANAEVAAKGTIEERVARLEADRD
jgi:hypothetical protein